MLPVILFSNHQMQPLLQFIYLKHSVSYFFYFILFCLIHGWGFKPFEDQTLYHLIQNILTCILFFQCSERKEKETKLKKLSYFRLVDYLAFTIFMIQACLVLVVVLIGLFRLVFFLVLVCWFVFRRIFLVLFVISHYPICLTCNYSFFSS